MSGPNQSRTGVEPQERRLRESWWLFAVSFLVLAVIVLLRLIAEGARPDNAALAVLVVVVGFAAILHRNRVLQLQVGRRAEAESLARILQGLSRSVSPDAIVAAIVEEVGIGAGADHVVVVRRRSEGDGLEATLVSSRPGVPSSTTLFPLSDLEDPHSGGSWVRDPIPIRVAPDPVLETIPAAVASAAAAWIDRPAASPSRPVTRLRPASARHLRQDWLATGGRVRRQLGRLESVLTRGQGLSIVDAGIGRPEDGALDGAAVRIAARIADRARSAYG
ncbi:MAG TPA: hypothetical protein VM344_07360, partial [Vitreimonas sp.]|nr:hypothetical protein [Vitreimonas sp.]